MSMSVTFLTNEDRAALEKLIEEISKNGGGGSSGSGGSGVDGISPTISVSKVGKVTTLTITDAEGTKTATIIDGEDGDPGKPGNDGVSPTVSVSKSGKVTTVTIKDAFGTKTATINDGEDGYTPVKGKDYFDGAKGDPGVSPTVSTSKTNKVTTLTITDAEGTKTATINDGEDGYTPVKGKDYFDGAKGDPGVSPIVDVNKVGKVTTLTITDAEGTKTATINDGEDGGQGGDSGVHVGSSTPTGDEVVWIDPNGMPSSTETWEFTLSDGSVVTKTVVVV